ncbi:MAG: hypothetical protein IJP86_02450 [Synergistaceae bacterium]|nr:hypothetical protein [Synergistaceae bacterium]
MKRKITLSLAAVSLLVSAALAGYQTFYDISLYVPDGWAVSGSSSSYVDLYDPYYPSTGRIYVELGSKGSSYLSEIADYLCYDYYRGSGLTAHDYYYDFVYTDSDGLIWNARVFDYNTESTFPSDVYCVVSYTEYVSGTDFTTVYDSIRYNSGGSGGGGSSGGCNAGTLPVCLLLAGFALFRKK